VKQCSLRPTQSRRREIDSTQHTVAEARQPTGDQSGHFRARIGSVTVRCLLEILRRGNTDRAVKQGPHVGSEDKTSPKADRSSYLAGADAMLPMRGSELSWSYYLHLAILPASHQRCRDRNGPPIVGIGKNDDRPPQGGMLS
jgi:hypothetical protein